MSQQKLLKSVLSVLNQVGIQYMLTGSIVSSLQGEPRSTRDIDVVIAIDKLKVREFARESSSPDFYLDEDSIRGAIESQGMFNLIDLKEGDKVDFWLLTNETFDKSRFSRKCKEKFMGLEMEVSSPEDTIG